VVSVVGIDVMVHSRLRHGWDARPRYDIGIGILGLVGVVGLIDGYVTLGRNLLVQRLW
jgi:hypothetical protein